MKEREIMSVMPNSSEHLNLPEATTLTTKLNKSGLVLTGEGRRQIENIMASQKEATIRMPLSVLELPDNTNPWVQEISVALRSSALVLLEAKGEKGPITLPTVTTDSDKASGGRESNSSESRPLPHLDVQLPSKIENEVSEMIRRLQPKERKTGEKDDWTTKLLDNAQTLAKQAREASGALPPPRYTQTVPGGALKTGVRRIFGRELLQRDIDKTMPSAVASMLVRIMEDTDASRDKLREVIAAHMITVTRGSLPKSEKKPSRALMQFAQFILSLKPKDIPEELGHTNRAARTPAELIRILSGAASNAKIGDVKADSLAAQESALRQVREQCATLARTRVPEDQQAAHDELIGKLLQTARLSTAFTQLKADEQRAVGSRLDQAAGILAKRQNVQARDVTKSVLAQKKGETKISPELRPQQ